jgi:hypothetical protein
MIVRFPDGTAVQATGRGRPDGDPVPDFGLYLDPCWHDDNVSWEHTVLDWPDRRLPGVASAGMMRPGTAAGRIQERIPFKFSVYSHFARAWRRLGCRPQSGSVHPERTDERYCVYDESHGDYLYTLGIR